MQKTAFLKVTQNTFAASSDVLLELTKPRAVVHLFSLRHILFFFLGSPSWHPGFLKLLPELIAKLLPEQCPEDGELLSAVKGEQMAGPQWPRRGKELLLRPGWEGRGDVTARQTLTALSGALFWGCSKQEHFWEAWGRKE